MTMVPVPELRCIIRTLLHHIPFTHAPTLPSEAPVNSRPPVSELPCRAVTAAAGLGCRAYHTRLGRKLLATEGGMEVPGGTCKGQNAMQVIIGYYW